MWMHLRKVEHIPSIRNSSELLTDSLVNLAILSLSWPDFGCQRQYGGFCSDIFAWKVRYDPIFAWKVRSISFGGQSVKSVKSNEAIDGRFPQPGLARNASLPTVDYDANAKRKWPLGRCLCVHNKSCLHILEVRNYMPQWTGQMCLSYELASQWLTHEYIATSCVCVCIC